jgi:hypothetical protein
VGILVSENVQVNPIAVNSKYCNVFTDNKRAIYIIDTSDFGKVSTFIRSLTTGYGIFSAHISRCL